MDAEFQTVSWSLDSNIYEVNLRQYTSEGNFRAFAGPSAKASGYGS